MKPQSYNGYRTSLTSSLISDDQLAALERDGYIILKKFWSDSLLEDWEQTVLAFYHQQALKIAPLRKEFEKGICPTNYKSVEDMDRVMTVLEREDKTAAYHAIHMMERSAAAGRLLSDPRLLEVASFLLQTPSKLLNFNGPNPFINLPSAKRLLYRWHSESSYYPKRRHFLNGWMPMFRGKNEGNGTMWFCKGSHKHQEWQFIEYQGYDAETHQKKDHFVQFEVPECELGEYEKVPVIAERGDLVIFNRSLVHTSTLNQSSTPSYATVFRIFEFLQDYSLSGLATAHPYKNDVGRPGLEPIYLA